MNWFHWTFLFGILCCYAIHVVLVSFWGIQIFSFLFIFCLIGFFSRCLRSILNFEKASWIVYLIGSIDRREILDPAFILSFERILRLFKLHRSLLHEPCYWRLTVHDLVWFNLTYLSLTIITAYNFRVTPLVRQNIFLHF